MSVHILCVYVCMHLCLCMCRCMIVCILCYVTASTTAVISLAVTNSYSGCHIPERTPPYDVHHAPCPTSFMHSFLLACNLLPFSLHSEFFDKYGSYISYKSLVHSCKLLVSNYCPITLSDSDVINAKC